MVASAVVVSYITFVPEVHARDDVCIVAFTKYADTIKVDATDEIQKASFLKHPKNKHKMHSIQRKTPQIFKKKQVQLIKIKICRQKSIEMEDEKKNQ